MNDFSFMGQKRIDDLDEYERKLISLASLFKLSFKHTHYSHAEKCLYDFHRAFWMSKQACFMLVYGDSGSGKTTLVKKYATRVQENASVKKRDIPILFVTVPANCTPRFHTFMQD